MRASLPLLTTGALAAASLSIVAAAPTASAAPAKTAYAVTATQLLTFDPASPATVAAKDITGLNPGESIAGIDVRPQNGMLYVLGINGAANIGTLYHLSPETGIASPAGLASGVSFTTDGVTPVDLPDPNTIGYGFDFNPLADRVRVTAGSLNFRINPNTGLAVDFDAGTDGTNPDGPINGATTTVDGAAYTNNVPSPISSTLYTLDSATNALMIQNAPNNGTQTLPQTVQVAGNTLDFSAVGGFDIDSAVSVVGNNNPVVSGVGYAALTMAGVTGLVRIDLTNAAATVLGPIGTGGAVRGLALQRDAATEGRPVVSIDSTGTTMVRFNTLTPGTTVSNPITGLTAGEVLVAVTWRNHTGQLFALGINGTLDSGTLYLLDPGTGLLTTVGAPSSLAWLVNGVPFDLPDPATNGYGFDVNPVGDVGRLVSANGLNAPVSVANGLPVDTNPGLPGTQPHTSLTGAAGATAAAFTNAYAQSEATGTTTMYVVDPVGNRLMMNKPLNNGTLVSPLPITLGGAALDFTALTGFDLPRETVPGAGTGYASFHVAGQNGFYSVDLATGAATKVSNTLAQLRSIAVGQARADYLATGNAPATLTKVAKANQKKAKVRTGQVLTCPSSFQAANCTVKIKLSKGKRVLGKATVQVERGTQKHLVVKLSTSGKKYLRFKGKLKATVTIKCPCGENAKKTKTTLKVKLKARKLLG